MKKLAAAQFKATCLKVMDHVAQTREAVEVTKRGKPLVRVLPMETSRTTARSIFGAARDTILYLAPDKDLFSTGATWDAGR